jgi:two-component system NtrC family response regulator/two-component system response regulator HydG
MESILLVDDDLGFRKVAETILTEEGYTLDTAGTLAQAGELGGRKQYHLILAGVGLPDGEGLEVLRWFGQQSPETPVVMIAASGEQAAAIEALRRGAAGCLPRPLGAFDELRLLVRRTLEASRIKREREAIREQEKARFSGDTPVALDPVMIETLDLALRAASTQAAVLVTGQPGTGKQLLARFIHARSPRAGRAFVSVNCATEPQELFGQDLRLGRVEWADGGTLYLDEVAALDMNLQGKLLRLLSDKTFERVGGTRLIEADVRLIAATSRDLRAMEFREDLYYRLGALSLEIPRLQQRPGDIPALAQLFLSRAAAEMGKPGLELSPDAIAALLAYNWPGNVRELENMMERVAIVCNGHVAGADLPIPHSNGDRAPHWREIERRAIENALEANHGNRTHAARQLGISLRKLQYRLKEYASN